MTLTNACGVCEDPAGPGRYVCHRCMGRVRHLLHAVPDLLAELEVTVTKLDRFRAPERTSGSTEPGVPFHVGASNARTSLEGVLATWACHVANALERAITRIGQPAGPEVMAAYLAETLDWSVSHPAGVDLVNQVERELTRAWHVVDRPVDRHYLGACQVDDCRGAVYQHGDRADARCSVCRTQVPAADRRAELLDRLAAEVLTAADVERVTAATGERIPAAKVRTWASRGRLQPVASIPWDAPPRYRLADVLALAGAA